jgi:hypothetical protein
MKVTFIFVGGESKVDKLITGVSGGDKSHVAIKIFDGILESTGEREEIDPYPGVWLHNPDKYDNNQFAEFIEVEIPDIEGFKAEARKLLGSPYGYTDCLRAGIFDLLGIEIPDNDWLMDCSELGTRLVRAGKLDVLPDVEAGCIDPMRLRNAILDGGYGKITDSIAS